MNRFFITSSAALFSKTTYLSNRTSFFTFSTSIPSLPSSSSSLWKRTIHHSGIGPIALNVMLLSRFRVNHFCSATAPTRRKPNEKVDLQLSPMEEDKHAFYVVRKGNIIGLYKNLSDCQAQVGSSVCDPSVSVYKGYSLPKEAESYLSSRGLKNSTYTVNVADAKEVFFGALLPCTFQQPASFTNKTTNKPSQPRWSEELLESAFNLEAFESGFAKDTSLGKNLDLEDSVKAQVNCSKCVSCTIEFDGASKGNPGQSGAGAVLKADDGSLVYRLREGVGIATNNVAEYRAILLGMKHALKMGFTRILVQGDSKLVCMQVQGLWKIKDEKMALLCREVKELADKFVSFQISHVLRDLNSEADAQANLGVNLEDGQVEEVYEK